MHFRGMGGAALVLGALAFVAAAASQPNDILYDVQGPHGASLPSPPLGAPRKSYVVYFDKDSAVPCAQCGDANAVLVAAKTDAERHRASALVAGYADGPETDGIGLSAKRAQYIARKLNSLGVRNMSVTWYGAKVPAVPTDGHRPESLNQRVVVSLSY